jgi:hypothetical protein
MDQAIEWGHVALMLLVPTAGIWILNVVAAARDDTKLPRILLCRCPDLVCVVGALILPLAALSIGLNAWKNCGSFCGISAALGSIGFLAVATVAAFRSPCESLNS